MFLSPFIKTVQLPTPEQPPEKVVPGDVNVTVAPEKKIPAATVDWTPPTPPTITFIPIGLLTTPKDFQYDIFFGHLL
jgi:hypothetical protein